jgi:hypothetical protein
MATMDRPLAEPVATEPSYHDRISLIVPTRGRHDQLNRMWNSALDTAVHPELVQLVLYVDDDDADMVMYLDEGNPIVGAPTRGHVDWIVGPRRMLSECWNEALPGADGEILGHMNDDVIFRTWRWDMEIREAFRKVPDRIACVHGRDGIHDGNMATLGFYSREWIAALGYFMPPYFVSDYNDTWLSTCADAVGRRFFIPEMYIEHMHPAVGKGPMDQTHQDRLTRHRQDNVDRLYLSLQPKRDEDVMKLRAAIELAAR